MLRRALGAQEAWNSYNRQLQDFFCRSVVGSIVGRGSSSDAMVTLIMRRNGAEALRLVVAPDVRLRCLQQILCQLFRRNFPWQRAIVVLDGVVHDGFESQPFLGRGDEELEVTVVFVRNVEDPFFFDLLDRKGPRATVADEAEYETAAQADPAVAAQGLELWAARRRHARG